MNDRNRDEMPVDPQANDKEHKAEVVDEEGARAIAMPQSMAMTKGEIESQLDAAHKYPRSIKKFLSDATSIATVSEEVAESCIYALPRGKNKDGTPKTIPGPSVRLAEIVASSFGNMHIAARVLDAEAKEVVSQSVVWDLEKNLRVSIEVRRKITDRNGRRFNDDMINVTGAAALSFAYRNGVFRVVPRGLVDSIYSTVREVAVGTAKTLSARREAVVLRLQKIGVPVDRIFARMGVLGIEDITLDHVELMIALGTAVKANSQTIDEAFPPVDNTAKRSKGLVDDLKGVKPEVKPEPKPEAKAETKAEVPHDKDGVVKEEPAKEAAKPAAEAIKEVIAAGKELIEDIHAGKSDKPKGGKKKPEEGVDDAAAEAALAGKPAAREPGID